MNEYCYDLAIRQRKCQNSISITSDNVYTNIQNGAIFNLSFGYTLTIVDKQENYVTIEISASLFLSPIRFNIPSNSFKTFDLPLYNGSFILQIGVSKNECPCPNISRW